MGWDWMPGGWVGETLDSICNNTKTRGEQTNGGRTSGVGMSRSRTGGSIKITWYLIVLLYVNLSTIILYLVPFILIIVMSALLVRSIADLISLFYLNVCEICSSNLKVWSKLPWYDVSKYFVYIWILFNSKFPLTCQPYYIPYMCGPLH